jgi:prepilin-type N-terminal cleavage/methylation domain-containing protein
MRIRRQESGFSMLEVMIALAIIAFAIFAIMSMILGTMASQEALRELQTAKEAAAQKIEQIKSTDFATALVTYPPVTPPTTPPQFPVPGLGDPAFSDGVARGSIITQTDSKQTLMDILVSVTWKGRKGKTTYSMRSLYAK